MSDALTPRPDLLAATISVPDHVVFRTLGDRTVLLNIQTCRYHGLNATGGRMLEVLSETGRIPPAAERVAEEYGVTAERVVDDLVSLCEKLAEHGLIEVNH